MTRSIRGALLFIAISVGFSLYFFGWALSSPVGSSADESRHLTSILCGDAGGRELCEKTGGQTLNVRIPTLVAEGLQCMEGQLDNAANCQSAIDDREFTEVKYPGYDNYPGTFYEVLRLLVGEDVTRSVVLIRVMNGLVSSLLFAAIVTLARTKRHFIAISVIMVLWSPVSFLIPSGNPSSWSITGAILLPISMVLLLDAARAKAARSMIVPAVIGALSIGIMVSSRFDALLAIPILITTAILCFKLSLMSTSSQSHWVRTMWFIGLPVISFFAFTVIFRLLGIFDDPFEGPPRHHQTVLAHNLAELPNYLLGFVGADPWNVSAQQGMRVPAITQMTSVAVVILVVVTAWSRHSVLSRRVFVSATMTVISAVLALHQSAMFYMPKLIQPRYFMPIMIGCLVAFVVTALGHVSKSTLQWCVSLTFVGQSLVLYQNFRRYVIGLREVGNDDLGCMACSMEDIGWWWANFRIMPVVIWGVAVIGFGVAMGAVYLLHSDTTSAPRSSSVVDAPPAA